MAKIYKIKDNTTGKTIDVPEEQLGQYGLDTSAPVQQQVQQPAQIQQQKPSQPSYITGHSPEEHIRALQAARANGDTAAEADIMSNYTTEIAHQKDLSSGAFDTPEQKVAKQEQTKKIASDAVQKAQNTKASNAAQGFLDTYNSLNGDYNSEDAKRKLAMAASKYNAAVGFGEGGKTLSAGEIGILAPTMISTERQSEQNILQRALGQTPDLTRGYLKESPQQAADKMKEALKYTNPEALKKYGDTTQTQTSGGNALDQILQYGGKTLSNAPGDVKNILNGILGMPKGLMDWQTNKMQQGQVGNLNDLVGEMAVGYGKNLYKDVGSPLEGGDVVGRAGQNFQDRPVSTVLDLLPFLGAKKLLQKAPLAGEAGLAAEEAANVAKGVTVPKPSNPLTSLLSKAQESMKGPAATNVGVADATNVTRSEALMGDALKMTKSLTTRGLAKELEAFGPKANEAIKTWTAANDKVIGLQPVDEFLATTRERLLKSPSGIADPGAVQKVMDGLEKQIKVKNIEGMTGGTNLSTVNKARIAINKSLQSWFKSNKPTASATDNINALNWEASDELKNFMGEAAGNDKLKELIYKEHVALETAPELAKQALSSTKDKTFWQAAYDKLTTPIKKAAEPIRIGGARALQGGTGEDLIQQLLNEANTVKGPSTPAPVGVPQGPSAANMKYIQEVLDKAKKAPKSPPLSEQGLGTIKRDMRFKQGNFKPRK